MPAVSAQPPTAAAILTDPIAEPDGGRCTHRIPTLEETCALAWSCRAAAGVSLVADITGLDYVGMPVVNTVRPFAERGNLTVTCDRDSRCSPQRHRH